MLDLDALDSAIAQIVQGADGETSVASDLAVVYDDYARGAVITGADCSQGGSLDLLEAAFTTNNATSSAMIMANNICTYWQSLPMSGAAAHGGVAVVAVTPAFATLAATMASVITGLITSTQFQQPYKRFFKAVEDVLKTAPVVITEAMPTSPPTTMLFTEYLQ